MRQLERRVSISAATPRHARYHQQSCRHQRIGRRLRHGDDRNRVEIEALAGAVQVQPADAHLAPGSAADGCQRGSVRRQVDLDHACGRGLRGQLQVATIVRPDEDLSLFLVVVGFVDVRQAVAGKVRPAPDFDLGTAEAGIGHLRAAGQAQEAAVGGTQNGGTCLRVGQRQRTPAAQPATVEAAGDIARKAAAQKGMRGAEILSAPGPGGPTSKAWG